MRFTEPEEIIKYECNIVKFRDALTVDLARKSTNTRKVKFFYWYAT